MEDDFSLVKRRNKRSTAGNRMQALMSGVLELEDAFMEVENDEDFVGKDGTSAHLYSSHLPFMYLAT